MGHSKDLQGPCSTVVDVSKACAPCKWLLQVVIEKLTQLDRPIIPEFYDGSIF